MYISYEKTDLLDKIIKTFEVGYRSYIADIILDSYTDKLKFTRALDNLKNNNVQTSLIQSGKHSSKINSLLVNNKELYDALTLAKKSLFEKDFDYNLNAKVPYVSEIIDLTLIFFNPLFTNLVKGFNSNEHFLYSSDVYKNVRNILSHPASSKIEEKTANEALLYVQILMDNIDKKYFWFRDGFTLITSTISDYYSIENKVDILNNFSEIEWDNNKVISRENEIETIQKYIISNGINRTYGSLVIYGYGGVGKTALMFEFLKRTYKNLVDKSYDNKYDFLLYFTNKEEKLTLRETTDKLHISNLRKQVNSFEALESNIFSILNIQNLKEISNIYTNGGIIFIDNFETFSFEDKSKILDFINKSPRNVQYILTSRNEEDCEKKINLKGFENISSGKVFIREYCKQINLEFDFEEEALEKLIKYSQGNTLIILLALERTKNKIISLEKILLELSSVTNKNTEILAEFMYKNTFDQTLHELELKHFNVKDVLKIIALYNEPIDVYSINKLSNIEVFKVEEICNYLSTKLILVKENEMFSMTDFAIKFIFSKLLPPSIERNEIDKQIRSYKQNLKISLEYFNNIVSKESKLKNIMDDWLPNNYIDKLAIVEAYSIFNFPKQTTNKAKVTLETLIEYDNKFKELELRTNHPYIKFQKARVFKYFKDHCSLDANSLTYCKNIIRDYFEQTILNIKYYYPYIKNTHSYAAVLWMNAKLLYQDYQELDEALASLEDAMEICEKYKNIKGNIFYDLSIDFAKYNRFKFIETNNPVYKKISLDTLNSIPNNLLKGVVRKKYNELQKWGKLVIHQR